MNRKADNLTSPKAYWWDHLEELRSRLVKSILALLAASTAFFYFVDEFLIFLTAPVKGLTAGGLTAEPLHFISPAEAFLAHVLLTFLGGFCLALPVVCYQFWAFVAAALTPTERKYVLWCAPASLVLFAAGAVFAYLVVLPISLKFLMSFASADLVPMITVYKYLSFVGTLCLGFGLVFEMPLAVVFLALIGIASPAYLGHIRRYVIVGVFAVSALVTPPDVVSQFLMALPLIVLYELSIVLARVVYRPRW